jgi:hypothetical protein
VTNVPLAMAQRHPQYNKWPVIDHVFLSLVTPRHGNVLVCHSMTGSLVTVAAVQATVTAADAVSPQGAALSALAWSGVAAAAAASLWAMHSAYLQAARAIQRREDGAAAKAADDAKAAEEKRERIRRMFERL